MSTVALSLSLNHLLLNADWLVVEAGQQRQVKHCVRPILQQSLGGGDMDKGMESYMYKNACIAVEVAHVVTARCRERGGGWRKGGKGWLFFYCTYIDWVMGQRECVQTPQLLQILQLFTLHHLQTDQTKPYVQYTSQCIPAYYMYV